MVRNSVLSYYLLAIEKFYHRVHGEHRVISGEREADFEKTLISAARKQIAGSVYQEEPRLPFLRFPLRDDG